MRQAGSLNTMRSFKRLRRLPCRLRRALLQHAGPPSLDKGGALADFSLRWKIIWVPVKLQIGAHVRCRPADVSSSLPSHARMSIPVEVFFVWTRCSPSALQAGTTMLIRKVLGSPVTLKIPNEGKPPSLALMQKRRGP